MGVPSFSSSFLTLSLLINIRSSITIRRWLHDVWVEFDVVKRAECTVKSLSLNDENYKKEKEGENPISQTTRKTKPILQPVVLRISHCQPNITYSSCSPITQKTTTNLISYH